MKTQKIEEQLKVSILIADVGFNNNIGTYEEYNSDLMTVSLKVNHRTIEV